MGGRAWRRAADDKLTSQPPPSRNDVTETPSLAESTQRSWGQELGARGDVLAASPHHRAGQEVPEGSGAEQTVPCACLGHVTFAPRGVCRGSGRKYRK